MAASIEKLSPVSSLKLDSRAVHITASNFRSCAQVATAPGTPNSYLRRPSANQNPIRFRMVPSRPLRSAIASSGSRRLLSAYLTVQSDPLAVSMTRVRARPRVAPETRENSSGSTGPSSCHGPCWLSNSGRTSQIREPCSTSQFLACFRRLLSYFLPSRPPHELPQEFNELAHRGSLDRRRLRALAKLSPDKERELSTIRRRFPRSFGEMDRITSRVCRRDGLERA